MESDGDSTSDRDDVRLGADTLAILRSFLAEKEAEEARFNLLRRRAEERAQLSDLSMQLFSEDWQLSQFWYDDHTASHLATHAIAASPIRDGRLACVSAPTVFVEIMKTDNRPDSLMPYVFEYDRRFSVFAEAFVFFDFNTPTTFSHSHPLQHQFDTIVVDPPFLSDECWSKTSECVRWLAKPECKIIVCTGLVMRDKILTELGCKLTDFVPKHKRGLSNEFGCFTNFESD
ncbi:EEF1A lysine methyltransferase 1, partial [Entophlyctis luteolus]